MPHLPAPVALEKPKAHYEPAYDGLTVALNKIPLLKNPQVAQTMLAGPGTLTHLRSLASNTKSAKKAKAEKERQKAEARLALLSQ